MSNRRIGRRNQFNYENNNIAIVICIIITIISVLTTIIVLIKNSNRSIKEDISIQNETVVEKKDIQISDENIVEINNLISFLCSNTNLGESIDDNNTKYYLTCKYFCKNNNVKEIKQEYISSIDSEIYRQLGYIFFDDLKDNYMYISKQDYINTYNYLFVENEEIDDTYSKYYIKGIDGIITPKDTLLNDSKQYKVKDYIAENDEIIITMQEVDLFKLYQDKEYDEILQYLNNSKIDINYSSNSIIKIKMKLQNSKYVFDEFTI